MCYSEMTEFDNKRRAFWLRRRRSSDVWSREQLIARARGIASSIFLIGRLVVHLLRLSGPSHSSKPNGIRKVVRTSAASSVAPTSRFQLMVVFSLIR